MAISTAHSPSLRPTFPSHVLLAFLLLIPISSIWTTRGANMPKSIGSMFNVMDYGAEGDGTTDDTKAFLKAWKDACEFEDWNTATILLPMGNVFLLHPMTFSGPCKANRIHFLVWGNIVAPEGPKAWRGRNKGKWIIFQGVKGLSVSGTGAIDGRGRSWWDISCTKNVQFLDCVKLAPTVLSFMECSHVSVRNIQVVNSPQAHILIAGSSQVTLESVSITAPETSPNTDGIHISSSKEVQIINSNIGSGDDCVSIGDHTEDISVTDVTCGPGHGISIGSLGRSGNEVEVKNIKVTRVHFIRTTNGLRIKTWQAGRGYVKGVVFRDVRFTDVKNPIIIDQYYCNVRNACDRTKTGVQISNVRYFGTVGTSKSKVAINLNCSQAVPCKDILLNTILLAPSDPGDELVSSCNNAYGTASGFVEPDSCLRG